MKITLTVWRSLFATGMRLAPKTRENKKMMPPRSLDDDAQKQSIEPLLLLSSFCAYIIRIIPSRLLTPITIIQANHSQQRASTAQETNTERGNEIERWQVQSECPPRKSVKPSSAFTTSQSLFTRRRRSSRSLPRQESTPTRKYRPLHYILHRPDLAFVHLLHCKTILTEFVIFFLVPLFEP
jgi:hypothetical protein